MNQIYSGKFPKQAGGDEGCMCRTCGKSVATYLDQCGECRASSKVDDDRRYLEPGGEWDRRQEADRKAKAEGSMRGDPTALIPYTQMIPVVLTWMRQLEENGRIE